MPRKKANLPGVTDQKKEPVQATEEVQDQIKQNLPPTNTLPGMPLAKPTKPTAKPGVDPVVQAVPVSDADSNRELTEEEIQLMADQMGVPREQIAGKVIKMSEKFIEQMKAGKVKFQQPSQPQPAPNGFRPPTPRNRIEQRYAGVLRRAMAMRKTQNLPASTTGRAVSPAAIQADDNEVKPSISAFMELSTRKIGSPQKQRMVLGIRPSGAPNIIQECKTPIKLMLSQHQSPGDILMLSRAIDDLHKSYPGMFQTRMRTPANDIWANNPNNADLKDDDPEVMWVQCEYKLINTANKGSHHFSHGFRKDLEARLGLPIDQTHPQGAIYLSDQEKSWYSQIWEMKEKNVPFWIIDAGRKSDYTAKHWEVARFQELVDRTPDITWVQIGASTDKKNPHFHPELKGDNVINLVGKTTIRQLIRLVYHCAGVVTPVSFPMHLAAAVPVHPRYRRTTRPCVVIAGGREPAMWEAYSTHQFLHTCGMLPCCSHGGCWKSRVMPIGDGDDKDYNEVTTSTTGRQSLITRLCEMPVTSKSGQIIPRCLDMITVDMVENAVRGYLEGYDYSDEDDLKWRKIEYEKPEEIQSKIDEIVEKTKSGEIVRKNATNYAGAPRKDARTPLPAKKPENQEEAEQETKQPRAADPE